MVESVAQNEEVGSVRIDGEEYLVNLIWSGSSDKNLYKEQMRVNAQQLGTKLICQYKTTTGMHVFGLADPHLGHKKGGCALAAMLSLTCGSSFLGAWEVDNELWVLIGANDDGVILVDKVCRGPEEIAILFESNFHLFAWEKVYAPDFLYSHADSVDIREFLDKKVKVTDIGYKKRVILLLSVLALIVLFAAVLWKIWGGKEKSNIVYAQNPIRTKHQIFPGTGSTLPINMIISCRKNIFRYTYILSSLPGWKSSDNIDCDGKKVHLSLERVFGSKEWLNYGLKKLKIINYYHQIDAQKAEVILPIAYKSYNDKEVNVSLSNVKNYLISTFQNLSLPINISGIQLVKPVIDEGDSRDVKYDKKYYSMGFNFSAQLSLQKFIPILNKIDGLVIRSLSYSPVEQSWEIDAVVYSSKK
ncbi:type 4b pilus protein PilO2 [Serratia sp. UGAL515B_01]|uniref:type 4b pilus protein PilO2 n=1 Tax=Serratia sp. UGAL515B_01 TaxID=2986763 RepID=UPI0029556708|nr:type 4b pilus protein PilO2 [Serratia sp. UGAL515B_01]WON76959.1 type 4b pilus protein PilO2 [Serratia sp. UGAL515B_01]